MQGKDEVITSSEQGHIKTSIISSLTGEDQKEVDQVSVVVATTFNSSSSSTGLQEVLYLMQQFKVATFFGIKCVPFLDKLIKRNQVKFIAFTKAAVFHLCCFVTMVNTFANVIQR